MATEYTPVISTDENGEEFVDYDNGQLNQRDQFHRGLAPQGFEIDEETGEHFVYEEPEHISTNDEYMESIAEAFPELPDALTYAQGNLDPELMGVFYAAAEEGNYDQFHEILYIIMSEWEEHLEQTGMTPEEEEVEESTDEEEDVYETPDLSNLYEQEPDVDVAYEHADLAEQTEGVESLLWSLSASFYNGDLTQDEAIEQALSSGYSRNELIETFHLLTESNK